MLKFSGQHLTMLFSPVPIDDHALSTLLVKWVVLMYPQINPTGVMLLLIFYYHGYNQITVSLSNIFSTKAHLFKLKRWICQSFINLFIYCQAVFQWSQVIEGQKWSFNKKSMMWFNFMQFLWKLMKLYFWGKIWSLMKGLNYSSLCIIEMKKRNYPS